MTRHRFETDVDFNLHFVRLNFERQYGRKLRKSQWEGLLSLMEQIGMVSAEGKVKEEDIQKLVKIKISAGRNCSNFAAFNTYYSWYSQFQLAAQEKISGFHFRKSIQKLCREKNGYSPTDNTINTWFYRESLSFSQTREYTIDELAPIAIKALFSKPKKKVSNVINLKRA